MSPAFFLESRQQKVENRQLELAGLIALLLPALQDYDFNFFNFLV